MFRQVVCHFMIPLRLVAVCLVGSGTLKNAIEAGRKFPGAYACDDYVIFRWPIIRRRIAIRVNVSNGRIYLVIFRRVVRAVNVTYLIK